LIFLYLEIFQLQNYHCTVIFDPDILWDKMGYKLHIYLNKYLIGKFIILFFYGSKTGQLTWQNQNTAGNPPF
jgi:hypothetical protein